MRFHFLLSIKLQPRVVKKNLSGSLTYFLTLKVEAVTSNFPDYLFKDSPFSLRTEHDSYLDITCMTLVTFPLF